MSWEILGTIATIIILISFLMTDIKRIRTINLIGDILYLIYGIIIGSFSIILLNTILSIIQIYYLIKIKGE